MNEVRSICCYCGTGCGVVIQSEAGRIVGVEGDPAHPSRIILPVVPADALVPLPAPVKG